MSIVNGKYSQESRQNIGGVDSTQESYTIYTEDGNIYNVDLEAFKNIKLGDNVTIKTLVEVNVG